MNDRIKCKNPHCDGMILPVTAKKTGGYCMPCVQKQEREEREKYIRENRKDVNPFEGITDRVEIIKIMHQKRKHDPLINYLPYHRSIEELYCELSEHEEARLVVYAIDEAKKGNTDAIESICLELAAFTSTDLSKLHKFMIDRGDFYPSMIFKNASRTIVKKLFDCLEACPENRNLILLALAWAVDDYVIKQFSSWAITPPYWSSELYIPPEDYSREAGWKIDKKNQVKRLYLNQCYPLAKNTKSEKQSSLSTCTTSQEHCHWCNRELTNLFEIDLKDPIFNFIPLKGELLKIATCDVCSCYADSIYMEVTGKGEAHWSSLNKVPEFLPDDVDTWDRMPEDCLYMSDEPRATSYAANEFLPTSFSQVGGMPTWIQDFAYPDCPKCSETMIFIAQISNEDIEEYGEGIYYSYICPSCNITATNYQQS